MAQIGIKCVRGKMLWDECHRCRVNPLRPCHYTSDLLQMIERGHEEHPAPTAYTPSRMCGCDRQQLLLGDGDYYESYEGAWPLVRGTLIHSILEAGPGTIEGYTRALREVRLSTRHATGARIEQDFDARDSTWIGGQEPFTGKPDLLLLGPLELPQFPGAPCVQQVKIIDYKTSTIDHDLIAAKIAHVMQINMYAWLVRRALANYLGENIVVQISELEIIYLGYNRTRRFTSAGPLWDKGKKPRGARTEGQEYTDDGHEVLHLAQLKMLPDEVVEQWILRRIAEKQAASLEHLPPVLTGDAAWLCRLCPVRERCFALAGEQDAAA